MTLALLATAGCAANTSTQTGPSLTTEQATTTAAAPAQPDIIQLGELVRAVAGAIPLGADNQQTACNLLLRQYAQQPTSAPRADTAYQQLLADTAPVRAACTTNPRAFTPTQQQAVTAAATAYIHHASAYETALSGG